MAAVLLSVIVLSGCQTTSEPAATETVATEEESKPHSVIPRDSVEKPEWTLIEADLSLEDDDNTYASTKDFLYFAIVGSTAEDMELRFKLDEVTAKLLSEQPAENKYFIALDGERIGSCTLSDDFSVATVKGQHTYDEITSLATRIRGLSE